MYTPVQKKKKKKK
jgi:hypothetical protein